ncbi:MAG TPA: hypothetical protein VND66_13200 [Acidobacteriaceae bacterium]|nr:hypothetical protein [Acidobacteriaceae bacterium]
METDGRLDLAGRPQARTLIALIFVFLFCGFHTRARASVLAEDQASQVKRLYDAGKWDAVVRAVPQSPAEPADLELDRGLALAQLHRLREAEAALQAGHEGHPRDPRFLVELGGIAYLEKRFSTAKKELRGALALDPRDAYTNSLLASIYFLEGNLEGALKYWNRAGKPIVSDLMYDPQPRLDPLILDRAFQFSPGSVWKRNQFLTTQAELASLDLFPHTYFELAAQQDGSFKLVWHDSEQPAWDSTKLDSIASMLRGLPYQSVYPEFYNLNHKGLNWLSFVRWDDEKRWLSSEAAWPVEENPKRCIRFYFVGRNENWNITRTLTPAVPSAAGFNMRRAVIGAEVASIASWRWRWNLAAEYSYRDFRTLTGIPGPAERFFSDSSGLALRANIQRPLIRFPERRFSLDAGASGEAGKFTANPLGRYGRVEGSLAANWFPKAQGEDYETSTLLRAGGTAGQVPFDELYMLGFDRDNDLWMRGHNGLVNGQKGNAPLGTNFILSNSDIDKVVYDGGFLLVKVGPFVDTGDITDPSQFFGSPKWLTDTGLQATVRVLGSFEFVFGYGKDLRSGNNTVYSTVTR